MTNKELPNKNEELNKLAVFQDKCNKNVFRQLSENIDDVFWLRSDDEIIFINPAFEKIWGIPCAEIYQEPQIFTDSIHPDDKDKVIEVFKTNAFIKTGHFEYEYRIIRPDKQIRWIRAKSLPVLNDSGKIIRRVGVARDITEQKKSQEETSLLAEMLDTAPNSITVHDDKGKFLFANQKTFEIHGYSREEFLALNLHELDVPENAKLIKERIEKIRKNGQTKFEVEHYKKDGSKIPFEVYVKLVDWKGAKAMLSIATDISERKKMLNDLLIEKSATEKSRQFYKVIFEEAAVGIAHVYPDGKLFKVNAKFCEITGYSADELIKMNFAEITHPDDLEKEQVFIQKVFANEIDTFSMEKRYRHRNGHFIWIILYSNVVRDNNGKIEFAVCTISDITERKKLHFDLIKSKEKLEISEAKYKAAFQTSPDSVNINKFNGEYVEINEGFTRLTGFTEKDAIGKLSSEIDIWAIPTDREKLVTGLQKDGIVENLELLFKAKDGTLIPVLMSAKIIYLKGEPHILSVTRAIVDRKKMEQELILAKEKAEESNRLKTEFLNNMSHEVRTPMNGIIGFSEMLEKPDITEEKRKYYSKIVKNCSHRLLRIIDDILEISNLETKQEKLNETEFCLNDLLMELFSIFCLKSKERSIPLYLKKALHDHQSHIVSDKTKLNKILSNLIENALKFTIEGFIEFGYFIENSNLILFVKDTGIGILSKNQKIIFERFSQEDNEVSFKHGGLGLGLSICKENAGLLGGTVTLESEKGKGSTFFVTIPYKPAQALNNNTRKSFNSIKVTNDKYTILIAEDEEVNYLYIEALFENKMKGNYNLIHAKNGKEAVEICTSHNNIDLVLMDIKMPLMNGHEATEKIKEVFPNLPVIAQTAFSTESDKQMALKHGCDDFISKPINKEKLLAVINKYLYII